MARDITPGRGIPPPPQRGCRVGDPGAGCVAPPSNIPDILGRRALPSGRRAPGFMPRSTVTGHSIRIVSSPDTPRRLFTASCIALLATAMSFAIRGDIMGDFERLFALSKTDVGWISGAAFWGFGFSILLGGPLCDLLGMGALLRLAAIGHIGGALATIAAPNFAVLFTATLVIGIANGLVEATVNPLVATMYPQDKTRRLVALHAWFPGGIVIGGVLSFLFTQVGHYAPTLAPYTG